MICGGEPGGEETLQSEWEQRYRQEDMKRLSGEPYQVYTYGVGWHDADKPAGVEAPRPKLPEVAPCEAEERARVFSGGVCGR